VSTAILEKLPAAQFVAKFPSLYTCTSSFLTDMARWSRHSTLRKIHMSSVRTHIPYLISTLILSQYLCHAIHTCFFTFFRPRLSLLPHSCHMPRPSHPPWFYPCEEYIIKAASHAVLSSPLFFLSLQVHMLLSSHESRYGSRFSLSLARARTHARAHTHTQTNLVLC